MARQCTDGLVDEGGRRRSIQRVNDVVTSSRAFEQPTRTFPRATFKDLVALGKPKIALMTLITGGGTFALAAPVLDGATVVRGALGLIGVALLVMGAGALNMLIERDVDTLMERTKNRPLAAKRMAPSTALIVGLGLLAAAFPLIAAFGNPLSVGLAVLSLFLYVLVYTPMKRTSAWSLVVGAIPGAMPALMGGTLAAGRLEVAGVALFAIAFVWQLPHFLAISLYREAEYTAAGHKVFPAVVGLDSTKALILATTAPLAALGVGLWPLGLAGPVYAFVALIVGVWFTLTCVAGYAPAVDSRAKADLWARRVFIASLVWQTAVFGALACDRVINSMLPAAS